MCFRWLAGTVPVPDALSAGHMQYTVTIMAYQPRWKPVLDGRNPV